jgi:hypothetical protein
MPTDAFHVDLDADGCQLAGHESGFGWTTRAAGSDIGLNPHPGETFYLAGHKSEAGECADQHGLKPSDIADVVGFGKPTIAVDAAEGQEWITDQLAWAMICGVPATIHPVDRDTVFFELVAIPKQVLFVARTSKCVGVRVL